MTISPVITEHAKVLPGGRYVIAEEKRRDRPRLPPVMGTGREKRHDAEAD
jgi:hypothetical protein